VSEISGIQGPPTRAYPGPLGPGSAQSRLRALASAGMTKRARRWCRADFRAALTVIPDFRSTLSSGNLAQRRFVIPEFRVSEISGIQGPPTRAQSRGPRDAHSPAPQARPSPGAPGSRLCATALARPRSGRDDRGSAPHCHPGYFAQHARCHSAPSGVFVIPEFHEAQYPGSRGGRRAPSPRAPSTRAQPRGHRRAPSPGLLDPGSAPCAGRRVALPGHALGLPPRIRRGPGYLGGRGCSVAGACGPHVG
jgi:hypothetical protein